jgi:hypothetical protein
MEKLAEEVKNEYNNSLGDKYVHWAGPSKWSDEAQGRHPSEPTQLQEKNGRLPA